MGCSRLSSRRSRPSSTGAAGFRSGSVPRLRAPFATFEGPGGPGEVRENVDGSGPRKAVGELLTCPFCMDQWVATGFLSGMLLLPRLTRFIAGVFAVRAGADVLQIVYARAQKSA